MSVPLNESRSCLDIRRHPFDSTGVLNWMLEQWEIKPEQTLLILTGLDDGEALDNRIRVRLTKARKSVMRSGAKIERFGFRTARIRWTELNGSSCSALFMHRVVTRRQTFGMVIDDMKGTL